MSIDRPRIRRHARQSLGLIVAVALLFGAATMLVDHYATGGAHRALLGSAGAISLAIAVLAWLPLGWAAGGSADRALAAAFASMMVRTSGTVLAAALLIRLGGWDAQRAGLVMIAWYVGLTVAEVGIAVRHLRFLDSFPSASTEQVAC